MKKSLGTMKTFDDVWNEIFNAKTIYWENERHRVHPIELMPEHKPPHQRNGLILRVTNIDNFFGTFLYEEEIPRLYTN